MKSIKMLKSTALCLLFLVALMTLGGCGGGSGSNSPTNDNPSVNNPPAPIEEINPRYIEPNYMALNNVSVVTPNSEILTPELIAKAKSKTEVTSENHPRWTGFIFSEESFGDDLRYLEDSAKFGFNAARLLYRYEDLFNKEATQANTVALEYLDKMLAKAIEYDMHIDFMFLSLPGFANHLDENYSSTAELDLFTNPVKQAKANAIAEVLAKRYKDIPNSALTFSTLFEARNPDRSTGLPYPEYSVNEVGKFILSNITTIRAINKSRLIFCETGSGYDSVGWANMEDESAIVKSYLKGINNIIFTYNFDCGAYIYAGMNALEGENIDDNNHTTAIVEYPIYWYGVGDVVHDGYPVKIDGFLPEGTEINIHLRKSSAGTLIISTDKGELHQETLSEITYNTSLSGTRCYGPLYYSDKVVSAAIPANTSSINISCLDGSFILGLIELVMPEKYAVERWYYATDYDAHLGLVDKAGLFKRSVNHVLISPNFSLDEYDERFLPENNHITVKEDLTYMSEKIRAEATPNSIKLWGENCTRFNNDAVVRYESAAFGGTTWNSVKSYYEDVLKMYAEHNYSWFSNDWWIMTNNMSSKVLGWPDQEYAGYPHFNLELLQLLQKYREKIK